MLLVVAAALGGIGYLVSRRVVDRQAGLLLELGQDILPHVAQRIRNFRRVKVEDGRPVWEITARDAQFLETEGEVVVVAPRLTFYLDGGAREAHITGAEGRLSLDGRELRSLTLRGGVRVRFAALQLDMEEATYDRARDRITSPSEVTIRGRALEVRGRGFEVDVGPQQMRLLQEVHTTVHRDAASS
jgi:LPS export ABC transporter protein LptC